MQNIQISKMIDRYEKLSEKMGIGKVDMNRKMNSTIREALHAFCTGHKNPAIWCMGEHTRMLMVDFVNEMKNVKFIIDSAKKKEGVKSGFSIVEPNEIELYDIDGVIISSYIYRNEIKEEISQHHKSIEYLDIYESLEQCGIHMETSYYVLPNPHNKYQGINKLQISYRKESAVKTKIDYLNQIIKKYVSMKDFRSAIKYMQELIALRGNSEDRMLLDELQDLYEMEKEQLSKVDPENVLMLCIDGLRRGDLLSGKLPKLLKWVESESYFFENAYSSSTTTYESLIPVYGSNNNMRTKYFEKSVLEEAECKFIREASGQNRNIFFYTDTDEFINCGRIVRSGIAQTVTEKIWDFAIDAGKEHNGLFYVHVLYESHFSYANPYTEVPLTADGTTIFHDFSERGGGRLRTDYVCQQKDALKYIDDTLMPFLEVLSCRIVLFADHGNILMKTTDSIKELEDTKFTCHKDWIEIPIAIKCPELPPHKDERLISLMELNEIICCLLEGKPYIYTEPDYIKMQRSRLYNPDLQYVYTQNGHERELQAFELFIFKDGAELMVYENGECRVLSEGNGGKTDVSTLYQRVAADVTVCDKAKSI